MASAQEKKKLEVSFLEDYITEAELASSLERSTRTLVRWHELRIGPPRIVVGRKILYRKSSVMAWLEAREKHEPRARRLRSA
jgi:hypothetical protein